MRIWCNQPFAEAAEQRLRRGVGQHELLFRPGVDGANSELEAAEIAFGKPAVTSVLRSTVLRWAHIGAAGYTPWDRQDLFARFHDRGTALTRSSMVYSEPCAEHVLSFMLAWARQLPLAFADQQGARSWRYAELRQQSRLLVGQRVVIFGHGSIGARLVELLQPFRMQIQGVRDRVRGDESIPTLAITDAALDEYLAMADHVIDLLPLNDSTRNAFDAKRFAAIRRGAIFYNIGRGNTVDQDALLQSLQSGHLGAALLDVTDPEPLPPDHPLWSIPNCVITPHSAGGHSTEQERLVDHFLANLRRFESGEPLLDRVV
jgi:phosphoglycerate dehydrogenase-like enzyme